MSEKPSSETGHSHATNGLAFLKNHKAIAWILIFAFVLAVVLSLPDWDRRGRRVYVTFPSPSTAQASAINPWTLAVAKIKEDRGEATGKQAKVDIPHQVRHYSDTRRFLAIQVAEVRQHQLDTPADLVDLAGMLSRGEMVALKPVSEDYVLFGVGGNADKEPFTRYRHGKSISVFNEAGLEKEYARLRSSRSKLENSLAGFRREISGLKKRERSRRAELQAQIKAAEKTLKAEAVAKAELDRSYGNDAVRAQMFSDYDLLNKLAKSFPERTFNLEDASARRDLKVRMLSSLRLEALKVLEEIAASYRQKFNRPLPVTSLVRPDEYQHSLRKTNPNATLIDTPPHSTGLAFDVYYRFMTAEEQAYVMSQLAQLKDAARIEVLRENRDHYHVFAFVDGARPNETMIAASLGSARAVKPQKESHHAARASKKAKKKSAPKATSKSRSVRGRKRR